MTGRRVPLHCATSVAFVALIVIGATRGIDAQQVSGSINFLWMMAANREQEDRKYGVVNVQPEFASIPVGIDKGR